jgi:hypothetical protein
LHFAIHTEEISLNLDNSTNASVQAILIDWHFSCCFIPICKNVEKRGIFCYRGVSILSVIPKLFEKMICDEMTPIIRPQIFVTQHGFIKGRPNVTNLVEFSYFVIDKIENGNQLDGVLTDFSKAFNLVNHGLLCFDLMRSFAAMMVAWFWSYLTGRTQRVRLDDFLSGVIYCHSGVPQSSHLGPCSLFIM